MLKTTTLLFVVWSFVSCVDIHSKVDQQREEEANEPLDVAVAAEFKINLKLIDFDLDQENKVLRAADLIKKVITSDKFQKEVLNHQFKGERAFADNQGLSNSQIYRKILEGSETIKPGKDNEMDMVLLTYYEDAITIGYTYPTTRNVWMNTKYLNRYNPVQVTGNMMHEWLHKLGFTHPVKHTPERRFSVPYAVGYIMQKLAREEYQE
jgi:hypothetical protein